MHLPTPNASMVHELKHAPPPPGRDAPLVLGSRAGGCNHLPTTPHHSTADAPTHHTQGGQVHCSSRGESSCTTSHNPLGLPCNTPCMPSGRLIAHSCPIGGGRQLSSWHQGDGAGTWEGWGPLELPNPTPPPGWPGSAPHGTTHLCCVPATMHLKDHMAGIGGSQALGMLTCQG